MRSVPDLLPLLYQTEQTPGWSSGMRGITRVLLTRFVRPANSILELGCGTGAFTNELTTLAPAQLVVGVDISKVALHHAHLQSRQPPYFASADLQALPFADATFNLVIALDTFDQKGVDPHIALAESWRMLRPQGNLLVRVSAHRWLKSVHDLAFNTDRRFSRAELSETLQAAGFTLVATTYANTLLSPPIVLLRLLQQQKILPFRPSLYTAPLLNRLLALMLQAEARWLQKRNLSFGVSLYAFAQKIDQESMRSKEAVDAN